MALRALGWLWWCAWTGLVASDFAALCVAGLALGDIRLPFTWQAWHFVTFTLLSFSMAGVALRALGWLWWRAWTGLVAGDAAALCVAGVALGDIYFRFSWQAWHLGHWAGSGGALALDWSLVTFHFYCYVKIFGVIGELSMLVTFARDTCVKRLL